jgi:NTE family protein
MQPANNTNGVGCAPGTERPTSVSNSSRVSPIGARSCGSGHADSNHAHGSSASYEKPAPRVGLVLGGGGAVGAAYHAGALAAMEHDLGLDARDAEVIVGTSAGSLVGALLRLGVPAKDLAALSVGLPAVSARESLATWLLERPAFAPMTFRHLLHLPRVPRPSMLIGLARLAVHQRVLPVGALAMLVPDGREILAPHLEFLDGISDGTWPARPLLVCAVRLRDWRRTVFSGEEPRAPLSAALAASCAVPGYFAGVNVNGDTYVDGGVISATNADVLARHDLDLVIVVSPMTGDARRPSVSHLMRALSRRTLDAELRSLRRNGVPTVVIQPGSDVTQHMSMDFMSEQASIDIVRSSFFDTGAQIARSDQLRRLRAREVA